MGEQVAWNKCEHCNVVLHENEAGEYYPVVNRIEKFTLIRGEYIPIGSRLQYPRNWGKQKGATILLEHKITDIKRTILNAETELAKLERCLSSVKEWPEFD